MENNTNETKKPLTYDELNTKYSKLQKSCKDMKDFILYAAVGGYILGTATNLLIYSKASNDSKPTNAITIDVNKDGIEDIITYNSKHKNLQTFIAVKDSTKTITYFEADALYKQKQDSLKAQYEKQKLDLEKAIEQH